MRMISRQELEASMRLDFALFVERSFAELNPQTEYVHNWHLEVVAEALEKCISGKLKRLIVNIPPRSLKSHMASIAFPAFLLGHNPSVQIIAASYAQDLADKLAGDCRSLMSSGFYQDLFPSTRLASRRSAQRLHEDDLVGHVLPQGGWHLIRFPAIAEADERYTIHTPYGERTFTRRIGEALDPKREPLRVLAELREVQGECTFSGQYQQAPSPLGGGMIKTGWFKTYATPELPNEFELIFQSWDTACKTSDLNDYSVCTTWGLFQKHLYLLHVLRERLDYPSLRKRVELQADLYKAKNIVIEDRSSGTQLIQDLQADGVHTATKYESQLDKVMRMRTVSPTIANGFVHIPEKAIWLAEYLHEMSGFPKGKYDDQVDSTSQALDWIKQGLGDFGLIDYLKKAAEEAGDRTLDIARQPRWWMHLGPMEKTEEQKAQQVMPVQSPLSSTDSRPCEGCGGVMSQRIPGGLRCMQYGKKWIHPDCRPRIPRITRADVLNKMIRFR